MFLIALVGMPGQLPRVCGSKLGMYLPWVFALVDGEVRKEDAVRNSHGGRGRRKKMR